MNIEDFNITNPKTRWVKKGEIVQQQGTPTTKGYFVKKGLLRSYSMDEHG